MLWVTFVTCVLSFQLPGLLGGVLEPNPVIQILESTTPGSFQVLNISSNSDVIYGVNTTSDSVIIFECRASYPIQWIYRGDGVPEFSTNNSFTQSSPREFIATTSFRQFPTQQDTGNYTCKSIRQPDVCSFAYLFVPGSSLFTSKGGENITFFERDNTVRIPCSLSEPRAIVTVQKVTEGRLQCPMNESISFHPKTGYTLVLPHNGESDISGMYVCTGSFRDTVEVIHFTIVSAAEKQLSTQNGSESSSSVANPSCATTKCGKNAMCRTVGTSTTCKCLPGFRGNPYTSCTVTSATADETTSANSCVLNEHCDRNSSCVKGKCIDVCKEAGICAENADCSLKNHIPQCNCKLGYVGDPYTSCKLPNAPEPSTTTAAPEDDPHCTPNPCGRFAICKSVKRNNSSYVITCVCEKNFFGVPPNCRPECEKNSDCPLNKACTAENKCADPCLSGVCGIGAICRTVGRFPVCECARGETGDPYVECRRSISGPSFEIDEPDRLQKQQICKPSIACGSNAECRVVNEISACRCVKGYVGDPYEKCVLSGCNRNTDCPNDLACDKKNNKCVNPCQMGNPCPDQQCTVHVHVPTCTGSIREPETTTVKYLTKATSKPPQQSSEEVSDPCKISTPCGPNSICTSIKGVAQCRCEPNSEGNPYIGCGKRKCIESSNCRQRESCVDGICKLNLNESVSSSTEIQSPQTPVKSACNPSPCGFGAECRIVNALAICKCTEPYRGDPYTGCTVRRNGCRNNDDCPNHLTCTRKRLCQDPCSLPGMCGTNAICSVKNHELTCSCHGNDYAGDPYESCEKIDSNESSNSSINPKIPESINIMNSSEIVSPGESSGESISSSSSETDGGPSSVPCHPLPCGQNAFCSIATDPRSCACNSNYYGDPYKGCVKGIQCQVDNDCSSGRQCVNKRCLDPCVYKSCGLNQNCRVINNVPVCECKQGFLTLRSGSCLKRPSPSLIIPGLMPNVTTAEITATVSTQVSVADKHSSNNPTPADEEDENNVNSDSPCNPSPCGSNSFCRVVNDTALCACKFNMKGAPPNCRPQCSTDIDCSFDKSCQNGSCVNPCGYQLCGYLATCTVVRRVATCRCPETMSGDPLTACRPSKLS